MASGDHAYARACHRAIVLVLLGGCTTEHPGQPGPVTTVGITSLGGGESSTGDGVLETSTTSSAASSGDGGDTSSSDGAGGLKLDVSAQDTDGCAPEDICCLAPGELPPHQLLDDYIAAYPGPAFPHDLAQMQSFAPELDGMPMAWSSLNTGDEIVDVDNGGLTVANLSTGRMYAHDAALGALPVDAVIADVREDPPTILDLGGSGSCVGVGWAWGSILFDAADGSIDELVYLYVGYCSTDGDSEQFYYSDEATQICAPSG